MQADLEKARQLLITCGYTCVLSRDDRQYTSFQRGVKPLLQWLDAGIPLHGFCAADKVVGKAAAYLYVLLGVTAVYAQVISSPSLQVLEAAGIQVMYDTPVEAIRNRTNTGLCPMEQAVTNARDPGHALELVRQALARLQ